MDKRDDAIRAFIADPVLHKRLAKYPVQRCFRNSVLEDLPAGLQRPLSGTPEGIIPP
jgi:hypothetical protein